MPQGQLGTERRLTGRRTECLRPGRSGSSQCPRRPRLPREDAAQMSRSPGPCPHCPFTCVCTAPGADCRTGPGSPGRLWCHPPPHCCPRQAAGGQRSRWQQVRVASPSRSSSWSRSTCVPGCRRRRRSCVYLQPPPRVEPSVRSGVGKGRTKPARHQPWTHTALLKGADPLREGRRAFGAGVSWGGVGWGGTRSSSEGSPGEGPEWTPLSWGVAQALLRPGRAPLRRYLLIEAAVDCAPANLHEPLGG